MEGSGRKQVTLLPECLDDDIAEDNPVRVPAPASSLGRHPGGEADGAAASGATSGMVLNGAPLRSAPGLISTSAM